MVDALFRCSVQRVAWCMIKIFRGAGVGTPSKPPPPYEQLLPLPIPCFKKFLERSLNDPPTPHHPTSSTFHCYPPPHPTSSTFHCYPPPHPTSSTFHCYSLPTPLQAPFTATPLPTPLQAPFTATPLPTPLQAPFTATPLPTPLQAPFTATPLPTPLQAPFTATPLPIHHPSPPLKILIIHLECNLIQINETDWAYPLGLAMSPSEPSAILKMPQLVSGANLPPKLLFCFHSLISF